MALYNITTDYDKNGISRFKDIIISPSDMKKNLQCDFDHQKGREYTKKSFGEMRHRWWQDKGPELPIADCPSSCAPGGFFSERAVNVLRDLFEKYGDLHQIIMETGENYFLYDCWSFVDYIHLGVADITDDGDIKSITVLDDFVFPEVFLCKSWPGLIVDEKFKQIADDNELTGIVFSPIKVDRVSDFKDYGEDRISVVSE